MDVLSITPMYLFPPNFWLWTIVTFCFIETSIFILITDLLCIHLTAKLIEPLWGWKEVLKYFILTNLSVAFATTLLYLLIYFLVLNDVERLFYIRIHGLMGFNGGALVAVKQLLPDQVLFQTPLGRLKVRFSLKFSFVFLCQSDY